MDPKVTRNRDPYGKWQLSNLRGGCKPVSLFLFGAAYHNNYNALVGEVFVIIDAKRKRLAPKGKAGGECSFSYYLDEQDKVLRIGSASEYDCCPVSGCHRHSVLEGSNPRGWCHAHSSSKPKGKGMQRQRVSKHADPTGDIAVAAASGKPARVSRRAAGGKPAPASGKPARVNRRAAASGKAATPVSRQRRASSRAPAAPANEAQADELPYVHFDPGDRFPGDNRGDMNFGSYVAFYAKQHGVQIFAGNKPESCEIRKEAAAGYEERMLDDDYDLESRQLKLSYMPPLKGVHSYAQLSDLAAVARTRGDHVVNNTYNFMGDQHLHLYAVQKGFARELVFAVVGQVAQDVDNLIEKRDLLADEIHQLVKLDMPKVFGTTQQVTEFLKGSGCVLPSPSASGAAAAPAASHAASAPATGSIASAGAVASGMAAANADASAAGAVVGMDANAAKPAASTNGVKLKLSKSFRATVLQQATQVDQAFQDKLFSVMENEFEWNEQIWSPIGGWGPPSKIFEKAGANMVTDMHEVYCLLKL